jgi:hypothetical protein
MKNNDFQPRDDESLIKMLNRIGRMHSDVRPGFAERIKRQIPGNLKAPRHGPESIKAVMNLRIGKLVAAVVIAAEAILLLNLFGGVDLAGQAYRQGRCLAKRCLAPAEEKWNALSCCLEKYGRSIESGRQVGGHKTIVRKPIVCKQQTPESKAEKPKCKKTKDINTEALVAVVEREAGPGRPLEKGQSAKWSQLKAGKIQDSTAETARMNEQAVVDALRSFGRITGTYPSNLATSTVMKEFRSAYKTKQAGKVIPKDHREQYLANTTKKLKRLCEFYGVLLKRGQEPAYYGDKLEPGKANAVLMRWRLVTGEYRAVLGDLRIETVTAEQLRQLEEALSQ